SPVLLTQKRLTPPLTTTEARTVFLDGDRMVIDQYPDSNPDIPARADNLAYVLYTSGSTGKPKGVAMEHRPLVNLLCWQMGHSGAGTRTLQFAPLTFDVSFQEIFSTWCSGGTLVMIPEGVRRNPASLERFLTSEAVETLFLPFVALQRLAT